MPIFTSVYVTDADHIEVHRREKRVVIWLGSEVALTFPTEPDAAELTLLRLGHAVDRALDLIRNGSQRVPGSAEQPVPGWNGAGASVEAQRG